MTTITTRKKICIDPKYLDKNVLLHTLRVVSSETMMSSCTEEYGYVLSVNKISKVYDCRISPATTKCVIDIDIDLVAIKPVVGEEMKGNVCMISSVGIFVDFEEKFQSLIPLSKLEGYEISNDNNEISNGKNAIKLGDKVTVLFTTVDYNQSTLFSSCGVLV